MGQKKKEKRKMGQEGGLVVGGKGPPWVGHPSGPCLHPPRLPSRGQGNLRVPGPGLS